MSIAPNDFVHLHTHSEFSLLDGLGRITDLVDTSVKHGFDSLAVTDHGALYGSVAFYQAATKAGIKPIIGVETYVARRSMRDKEGKADSQPFHLVLLATDMTGYRNLCRLVTDAHLDGYYYKPRIDREHLAKYSEGLVGLSACLGGEVPKALEVDDWELARSLASEYQDILGKGRFFLELQDHKIPEQRKLNEQLLRLSPETGVPLIVTNDLHYVHPEQHDAHDVLLCVGTGNNLDTPNRMRFEGPDFYLKTAEEMFRLFPDQREALLNTRRVAEMVDLTLPLGELRIPHFPVPEGHTVETWLRKECEEGLVRRYGSIKPHLQERLDYELGVITSMGYAGYFLIVADFVRFARQEGIATTCRGSAPGSIVTYTLGITPVDPISYGLPFERFLNPDRVTMPDIDVDFEDERRDEVINYVSRKYGQDHVAQIITFGTMLARAALRDVGRVLGMSYGEVDRIAKAVPNQLGIKLSEALTMSPQLKELHDGDPQVGKLVGLAQQLEGVARNASTHAAGVVISREPLTELMPLQRATNSDALMTQYEMHGIEALGLLKFDFLGLSNLTILRKAVDLIRDNKGVAVDLDNIPLDDPKTFELLASGETTGVFQLESAGMRRYIRELQPTSVYDLAAMVALYRPGPMDNIPAYIRRKHGQEQVEYLHPLLEPYLNKTYGIFVYQEDIMAAAIALGGFTGSRGGHAGLRDPQEEVLGAPRAEGEVRQPGGRARRRAAGHRRGVQGLRAVRALRVQQGARHLLRADRVPDRVSQGELHGRVHDLGAVRVPRQRGEGRGRHRRVPPARDRGPHAGRPPVGARVHGRGRGDPVRAARREERRRGRDPVDHRRPRGGRRLPLAHGLLQPDRPPADEPQGPRVAGQGRGHEHARPPGPDPPRPRRLARVRPGDPARPDQRPDVAVRHGRRGRGRARGAPPADPRDAGPRAAPLGEGAHGALPLRPPDGRGRRPGRAVRDGVQRRPQGRVARRPAGRHRRDRDRHPVRAHQGALNDGRRDARGPPGHARGRRLPEDVRADHRQLARWRDPPRRRSRGPPRRRGVAARGLGVGLGRGHGPRAGGVRPRGRLARQARRATRGPRHERRLPQRQRAAGTGTGAARPGRRSRSGRVCPRRRRPPSPARPDPSALPPIAPAEPISTYAEPPDLETVATAAGGPEPEEPALPDEARGVASAAAQAPSVPVEASATAILNVRFAREAGPDRVVAAMQAFKGVLRERPGGTKVVVHVPAPGGAALPMELKGGVAYDAELVAEVRRRIGEGVVDLQLL